MTKNVGRRVGSVFQHAPINRRNTTGMSGVISGRSSWASTCSFTTIGDRPLYGSSRDHSSHSSTPNE